MREVCLNSTLSFYNALGMLVTVIKIIIIIILLLYFYYTLIIAIQILYVPERQHWVGTSYMNAELKLYDSMFTG